MGLDMYAFTCPAEHIGDQQIDISLSDVGGVNRDFAYWRKFNALHGWMEAIYRNKGGTEIFNCTTVRLMPEDIDSLETAAKNLSLTPVSGFFFGSDDPFNTDDRDEVLGFVTKARTAFSEKKAVIYYSWW
jgi:hypothetical protein